MSVSAPQTEPPSSATAVLPAPPRESFLPTAFQIWVGISVGMAIKFAGVGRLFSEWGIPPAMAVAWLGELVISAVLIGIGGALLFRAIQAKQLAWMQPGHWLAVESLALLLRSLLSLLLQSEPVFGLYAWGYAVMIPWLAECTVGVVWYVLIIREERENRAWRAFAWASLLIFGATGLALVLLFVPQSELLNVVGRLLMGVAVLLVMGRWLIAAFATANDLRTGNGRDTLHWLGLGCSAVGIVTALIQNVRALFP